MSCPHQHIISLNESAAASQLFIIPGTGGRCEGFRNLGAHFAPAFRVYGLHMMGTEKNETPFRNIQEIAAQNIRWMRSVQQTGPWHLLGHSFGAYVAFEMAQLLERSGENVSLLIILDQPVCLEAALDQTDDGIFHALQLTKDYCRDFKVMDLWPPEWSDQLLPALMERNIYDYVPAIEQFLHHKLHGRKRLIELVARFINVRIYNAVMEYSPQGKLQANILLFKAADEKRYDEAWDLGWSPHTSNLQVITVPGNHISLVTGNNAAGIVSQLMMAPAP